MTRPSTIVYNEIKAKIISGELPSSSSLPEQELANSYEASRNTIKKVLLMLEKEGLVTIELNKGAKVRSYSLEEVSEFLDLRASLEEFILSRTVPVITEEDIDLMESILKKMNSYYKKNELILYSEENQRFHRVIYNACPNRLSVEITTTLRNQMSKYNTKTVLIPGRTAQSLQEHTAILMAIRNRDAELASILIKRHIDNVRKTFVENYSLLM